MQVDHILVGAGELEAGRAEIAHLTGVWPGAGGSHPQWGSHNALLALGPASYLELVALRPEAPADGPFGFLRTLKAVTPIGWALATTDARRTRERLENAGFILTPVVAGARERPDGSRLEWATFGFADRPFVGSLPFLIEWAAGSIHPATDSPSGCSLSRLRIHDPEIDVLSRLRDALGLDVEIEPATAPGVELVLATPRGRLTLAG